MLHDRQTDRQTDTGEIVSYKKSKNRDIISHVLYYMHKNRLKYRERL